MQRGRGVLKLARMVKRKENEKKGGGGRGRKSKLVSQFLSVRTVNQ